MPSSPAVDLEHRLLLAASRRGADAHELTERATLLTAAALEQADPRRVAAGRPATVRERRSLADAAHEALAADPDRSLPELAADLGVSAHHLSASSAPPRVTRSPAIGCGCASAPRLSAWPAASTPSRGWPPISASLIRATSAVSFAARRGTRLLRCVARSPEPLQQRQAARRCAQMSPHSGQISSGMTPARISSPKSWQPTQNASTDSRPAATSMTTSSTSTAPVAPSANATTAAVVMAAPTPCAKRLGGPGTILGAPSRGAITRL